jgi:hypothetical protein
MQTTTSTAAKKHWTVPTITAVRSSSDAQAPKAQIQLIEATINLGIIFVAVGPNS